MRESHAEEIRGDAGRVLQEARDEAERDISSLVSDRDGVMDELQVMRDGLLATLRQLAAIIEGKSGRDGEEIVGDRGEATSVPPYL